jgi:CheY-like chemotaxis protein
LRSQLFTGASDATPWSGICDEPPSVDSGDCPEPVSDAEYTSNDSNVTELTSRGWSSVLPTANGPTSHSNIRLNTVYSNDQSEHNGSGAGLVDANLCVKEMGGHIGFQSADHMEPMIKQPSGGPSAPLPLLCGSVFWFDIPFVEPVGMKSDIKRVQPKSLDSFREFHCISLEQGSDLPTRSSRNPYSLTNERVPHGGRFNQSTHLPKPAFAIKSKNKYVDGSDFPNDTDVKMNFQKELRSAAQSRGRRCVLVVDDSVMVRKLLCQSLMLLNFDTDTARDGQEGLAKMKKVYYHAVLIDFCMPIMDGIAATAKIRAWERDLINDTSAMSNHEKMSRSSVYDDNHRRQLIIGISANLSDEKLNSAWEAGIDYFIRKPVTVSCALFNLVCKQTLKL